MTNYPDGTREIHIPVHTMKGKQTELTIEISKKSQMSLSIYLSENATGGVVLSSASAKCLSNYLLSGLEER